MTLKQVEVVETFTPVIYKEKENNRIARLSQKMHDDIAEIIKAWEAKGFNHKTANTDKVTYMLTRHKEWKRIKADLMKATPEEIKKYA